MALLFKLRALFRKSQLEDEMSEELRFHLEKQIEDNIKAGMTPKEARYTAVRSFGGVEQIKEECRDMRRTRLIEELWQDLRYALRMIRRSPGFTAVAVLALGIGIGANTAIFSVVDAVLLRPLPFPQPGRLVMAWENKPALGIRKNVVSFPNYQDWRDQNRVFESISPLKSTAVTLTGDQEAAMFEGAVVSASLFPMLGTKPIAGRVFLPEEDRPGANRVVVMSRSLWQNRFGADTTVVGRELLLDDKSYTVVGIVPDLKLPSFMKPLIWLPLSAGAEQWREIGSLVDRDVHFLSVIARIKPGVSLTRAQAEMNTIAGRLAAAYTKSNEGWGVSLVPLHEEIAGDVRPALLVLLSAVGFVLLIACANVANLLLARAALRRKEIALRAALGAGRARILRQLLTESALLSVLGGTVGLMLALWGIELVIQLSPQDIPRLSEIRVDRDALAFTALLSLIAGLLFGIAPGLRASRVDLNQSLKENDRAATGVIRHRRLRRALVVSEIALSVTLVIGAGLAIRSFLLLSEVNPGFQGEHVLTAPLILTRDLASARRVAFYDEVLRRVAALPGVEAAGACQVLPLSNNNWTVSFALEGRRPTADQPEVNYRRVAGEYFRALRIPLLNGRFFTDLDRGRATGVIIVNDAFARRFLPGENPVGARGRLCIDCPPLEIVGVVGNISQQRLDIAPRPELYVPYSQNPRASLTLVARTSVEPDTLAAAIRREVSAVDKNQPATSITGMQKFVDNSIAPRRFNMHLLGAFAAMALALAAIGIYGVMAYSVAQRSHEIGIRMALGARSADVLRMVLRDAVFLGSIGIAIGVAGALALTRLMTNLLYGVKATDPATFFVVSLLLAVVAVLAAFVPARRASRVDPMVALRYE